MRHFYQSKTLAAGLAMFSMFFGAGNVVFPLALGQYAQNKNFFAIIGLLITAVGVPFLGLIATTLFNGDYKQFFDRMGKIPGFIVATIIMGLIGPFGAIPRCIALSYSTMQIYLPEISLLGFSLIACIVIWLFTYNKSSIIEILGYYLTPILLFSLGVIIIKGFFNSPEPPLSTHSNIDVFFKGVREGYQTMDLLATFFFSSVVIDSLKKASHAKNPNDYKELMMTTLKAICIGASLLSIIYVGFSYIASFHSSQMEGVSDDMLISAVSIEILGSKMAFIACVAVALACLTTAIALSSVFAEFIHKDVTMNRVSYKSALAGTLVIAFFISTLNFNGIVQFLAPILQICYPALIVFSILNIFYKLFDFQPVKIPVLLVFIASIISYFI